MTLTNSATAAGWNPGRLGTWGRRLATAVITVFVVTLVATTVGPRVLPYRTYAVQTGSMEPTMPVGSMVVATPAAAADLEVGDIITFTPPGRAGELVTHRIVAIKEGPDGPSLLTRGDANDVRDSWRVPADGEGWRVTAIVPHGGFVVAALTAPAGRLGLLIAMLGWLAVVLLRRIWRTPEGERT